MKGMFFSLSNFNLKEKKIVNILKTSKGKYLEIVNKMAN